MKYRILNRILNITFKYQKLKHYKSLWTLSQYKAATWAESLLGASSGVGPGAVKIQFNLIFFQFNQFGHQLGALKSQFDFIQFNQFIFISTPARGSQNSIQFNSTNMFWFGNPKLIFIGLFSQRQVWSTSQYFDCSCHTGSILIFFISFWLLLSYRWVCTNVLVATCIFLTRGTFPNCSIENIHLVSEICIIWSSIPISFSVRLLRTFFWFCKSSYELRY